MKIRFSKHWAECEIEPEDIELERACPLCRLGKTAQGVCSECKGEGIIVTLLGVEILDFVKRRLGTDFMHGASKLYAVNSISQARNEDSLNTIKSNGKSTLATTAKLPEHPKTNKTPTHPAPIQKNGSTVATVPRSSAFVHAGASQMQRVRNPGNSGHTPQKRSW